MTITFKEDINKIKKGLYLVSTPIGNLRDISFRAIDILKNSNIILCEDTRVSKILLDRYQIKTKLVSYHKFNEKSKQNFIIEKLISGSIISLISDSGTPTISDPGSILINSCVKNKINIFPIPGPSAPISAASVSGFSEKFFFYGFFPEKQKIQKNDLNILSKLNSSIIFFISSKKFSKIIPVIKKYFYNRKILICREISKYYEEYLRLNTNELDSLDKNFKGEMTVVISEKYNVKKVSQKLEESDKEIVRMLFNKLSLKDIVKIVNLKSDISKKEIYNFCLSLKK